MTFFFNNLLHFKLTVLKIKKWFF